MLTLPHELREELKRPFGPIYEDAESLLRDADRPIVAVGDVVTYHLRNAGHDPHVAVVDGITEREEVADEVHRIVTDGEHRVDALNPPAELTRELLVALVDAMAHEKNTVVYVDGEEDLATLPAVLATPLGGSVVYGQPGEGMVLVAVTQDAKAEMRDLLVRFDGDADAALSTLGL